LQDQLRQAETREAERIGRIALKAGTRRDRDRETELQAAFEEVTSRFRGGKGSTGRKNESKPTAVAGESTRVWRLRASWRGLNAWLAVMTATEARKKDTREKSSSAA
jgi:hypothetical protein